MPELVSDPTPTEDVLLIDLEENCLTTAKEVAEHTKKDSVLLKVINCIQKGWLGDSEEFGLSEFKSKRLELSYLKGCVLWGDRVVIPNTLKQKVLGMLHAGHPGIVRMKGLARGYLWWPGLDRDIEQWVANCDPCQESRPNPPKTTPLEWERPTGPWSRIHIDFAGPIGTQNFLIVVDAFSRWVEIIAMQNITTCATIKALYHLFATHGCPDILVSDNGPQLTARQFECFLSNLGVRHALTSPYSPWVNGLAERYVRVAKEALRRAGPGEIQHKLDQFLLMQHITPNSITNKSPAEILMGRKIRSPLDRLHPRYCTQNVNNETCITPERNMYVGQLVFARNFDGGLTWLKGKILQQTAPKSYVVQLEDGRTWRRHIDHLRGRITSNEVLAANGNSSPQADINSQLELLELQKDLPRPDASSSDAEPSSSSGHGAPSAYLSPQARAPTWAQPRTGDNDEPTSTIDIPAGNDLRRSERTSRRPNRLEDYVTWLTE